jgi:uncharacterized repeat protein (TIGR01451 family)
MLFSNRFFNSRKSSVLPAGATCGLAADKSRRRSRALHSLHSGVLCLVGVFAAAGTSSVQASGTAAGTRIPNSVTLTYSVNGQVASPATASAPVVVVAELINVVLTRQDGSLVTVSSPDTGRTLSFLLTNTGNAIHTFRLVRNNALAGDQFDPVSAAGSAIYLESGAQPGFQASGPNADTPYLPGQNDPALAADASRMIYLLSNIPPSQGTGAVGNVSLTAGSTTAGAAGSAPGTGLPGQGQGGGMAVVGGSRAQAVVTNGYVVSGLLSSLVKTVAVVRDPAGGSLVMPGAELTYRIVLTLTGTGVAENLALSDPLPASTSYVPGSLSVDGVARTDAADADNANYAAGVIRIAFGDTPAPATRVIEFKTIVN